MSEEAVGQQWKSSATYTLRHCAGHESYTNYKKEWITALNCKNDNVDIKLDNVDIKLDNVDIKLDNVDIKSDNELKSTVESGNKIIKKGRKKYKLLIEEEEGK